MLFDGDLDCLESKEILIGVEIICSANFRVLGERERGRGEEGGERGERGESGEWKEEREN